MSSLELRVAELERQVAALQQSKPKAQSVKAEPKPAAEPKEPKEKSSAQSGWAELLASTVADMRQNGWPAWTSLTDDTAFAASELKEGKHVFSAGPLAGKEASPAVGGMARASFLKLEADPVAAAKARESRAKRIAKVAENASKKSGSSTGSAEKAEPVADAPAVAEKPKRVLSPEHKAKMLAAAAAAREAKKAAKAEAAPAAPVAKAEPAPKAEPAAPKAEPLPAKPAAPKPVKAKKPTPAPAPAPVKKEFDLNFSPWTYEYSEYIKNERGDVLTFPEAEWVGRFDGKKIDESVERPEDIDEFLE
jgi:hypothetical protein